MSDELDVLKDIAARLNQANVPYMLTGSMALGFYATPRMTRDIDFVVETNKSVLPHLKSIFEQDYYFDTEMADEAISHKSMFNIIHNRTLVKVDFVIRKDEPYRKAEFERRRMVDYGGLKLWIVSAEDLILSKLYWAKDSQSDTQLKDVASILEGVPSVDMQYLEKWMTQLGLENIYAKVKK